MIWKTGKVLFLLILVIGAGFIATLIISFMPGAVFYRPFCMVVAGWAAVMVLWKCFGRTGRRRFWQIVLVSLLLFMTAAVAYELRSQYIRSIPTINEDSLILDRYAPFVEGSKVARLAERPELKLHEQLPRLDGATALYPLYAAFVQAVYPEGEYKPYDSIVTSTTTSQAYKRLIEGKVDIVFAAQPSKEQLATAAEKGVELKLTPIGKEAFVFFVHADNPVKGLSSSQLRDIYSGKVNNWSKVGGDSSRIRAFQRPKNSGSQTMLTAFMDGTPIEEPPTEDVAGGMGEIITQTADYRNYPNAIGYSFLFYATEMASNGDIRLLAVDGVNPSRETIRSGEYPLAKPFYAVTAGSDNPNIDLLIDWILSPQGQELVHKTGYTPLAGH
ncbi:PstS family phosphate ABC transporter substrate-binding protein [Paenibacillus tarimensis]|uniref:PstS family phosphate ABC transporter substrate-binding protein n=1 Tax=Paenibacillus tarimensis TaxID=416012 RepID=UPI0038B3F657